MALTLTSGLKAKRQALSQVVTFGFKPAAANTLSQFFQDISQIYGNPDLQLVPIVANSTTDAVVADVACKLYGIILKGGLTAADLRIADHATSANSPTVTLPVAVSQQVTLLFNGGTAYANGITFDESTTAGPTGFFIIGAA
jgi:hypothetical protein